MKFINTILIVVLLASSGWSKGISEIKMANLILKTNLLQNLLAKEFCSCIYVVRPGNENLNDQERMNLCFENTPLPIPRKTITSLVSFKIDSFSKTILVQPTMKATILSLISAKTGIAQYISESEGCRLKTQ